MGTLPTLNFNESLVYIVFVRFHVILSHGKNTAECMNRALPRNLLIDLNVELKLEATELKVIGEQIGESLRQRLANSKFFHWDEMDRRKHVHVCLCIGFFLWHAW